MSKTPYERYEHYGCDVAVRSDLKGKHWEFCLCGKCAQLKPGKADNCIIADRLYKFDKFYSLVTPVWECPDFLEGEV